MATCANCASESLYVYQVAPGYGIEYCQYHLPKFLYTLRNSGALDKVEVVASEEPVSKSKKKPVAVVEEPVVEAPTDSEEEPDAAS